MWFGVGFTQTISALTTLLRVIYQVLTDFHLVCDGRRRTAASTCAAAKQSESPLG
jgi:hypothetical protein